MQRKGGYESGLGPVTSGPGVAVGIARNCFKLPNTDKSDGVNKEGNPTLDAISTFDGDSRWVPTPSPPESRFPLQKTKGVTFFCLVWKHTCLTGCYSVTGFS